MKANGSRKKPKERRRLLGVLLVTLAMESSPSLCRSEKVSRPDQMADTTMTITIHVSNDAEVAPRILVEAKRIAAKAFRDAGVETRWLDEDPSRDQGYKARPFRSLDMAVRIAAHFMAQSLDQPDDALGVAPGSGPNRHLT